MTRDFAVVDVDSHVWEPESIWSDYVPSADRDAARNAFSRTGDRITLNGAPARSLSTSRINRFAIWRPGMTVDEIGALDPQGEHADNLGASDASARVADLDALGIAHQVVLPELFGEYFPAVADADAAAVLARAYNNWAMDLASASGGRLHPAAVLPLQEIDAAIAELERVAAAGMRSAVLRPAFYAGHGDSGNPVGVYFEAAPFRPVWRRIEELGLVACVHPYLGIANQEGTSEGAFVERVAEKLGIGHTVAEPVAYLQDNAMFVVVAAFHGLLEDFPSLKLALLHSGASMIPLSLEKAETYLWLSPQSIFAVDTPVCLEPEDVFRTSRAIVGFDGWDSAVPRQPDFFGEKAAWGSRYPHHDTSAPHEAIALCERYGMEAELVARVMGGNAAELFGISIPAYA